MDFEYRKNEKRKRVFSPQAIITVIEISKKINELLELGDNNSDMILTKSHIKTNVMQLINSMNSDITKVDKTERKDRVGYSKISYNYHVNEWGRLITNYYR
jgi:hypothetical protein